MSMVKSSSTAQPAMKAEDVAEAAQHEVLAAAGNGIGRGQLGVRQADADVDDAGKEEGDVRGAGGRSQHQAQADEDVGADVRVAPREGAPRRDGPAEFRIGAGRSGHYVRRT